MIISTFVRTSYDTVAKKSYSTALHTTTSAIWAATLEEAIRSHASDVGREATGARNSRSVIVIDVDETEASKWREGSPVLRKGSVPSKPVTIHQQFPTVSECAAHLGMAPSYLSPRLTAGKGDSGEYPYKTAVLKGVTLAYVDDFERNL